MLGHTAPFRLGRSHDAVLAQIDTRRSAQCRTGHTGCPCTIAGTAGEREAWDHLLRLYETDWDDAVAIRARTLVMQQAAAVLASTNQTPETREMHREKEVARLHAIYVHLSQQLMEPLKPSSYTDGSFDHQN